MKVKQFAVIGIGRFGSSVATQLYDMGHDVLVIDSNEDKIEAIIDRVTHGVVADSTSEAALRSLGITNFDVVIVSIGQNIQASILTTLVIKEMGVNYIVAKARTSLHGKVLQKIGADRIIHPERDMGIRVANNLVATNVIDFIELSPDYSIVEIIAPDDMVDKSLRELDLRAKYGVNVLAIRGADKKINVSPAAHDQIKAGDLLIVVGENEKIQNLSR
ncbi:potassium channel family protein [Dethiobacter alkaliphilus]|uniref:potassium channel family protein n=1 Tax=Dethiobacter alkaliphilus TaxID=427926 RepID=UPI0022274009|nr:TrkA family potassium uptake protein [Dethiobacter alkaliphilus]MCW3491180.1 TrkA family potassium uptake protein [Dethiobacter alkaliphilus]